MRAVSLLVPLLAAAGVPIEADVSAPDPVAVIVTQPSAPIEITAYTARFQRRAAYTTEGIRHSLTYTNRSSSGVVAIRFGLVSFNVFNQFLGKTGGISMDDLSAGRTEKGEWVHSPYADFSFHTGVAYVDAVRLDDGTIWHADESVIVAELRKLQKDFDAKMLEERRQPSTE